MVELNASLKSTKWMFGAVLAVTGWLLIRTFAVSDQMTEVQVKTERTNVISRGIQTQNKEISDDLEAIQNQLHNIELVNERLAERLNAIAIKEEERERD